MPGLKGGGEGGTVAVSHDDGPWRDICTHMDIYAWFVWEKSDRTSKACRHEEIDIIVKRRNSHKVR